MIVPKCVKASKANCGRCNAGGETGNDTETITMNAGDPFTIHTDVAVYHQGPLSMSVLEIELRA
jgi:hypothetical protein